MYPRYESHDDATLSYMDNTLHCFHSFKYVLLLGWAGKKGKAKANALRTELVKKGKVDEETSTETWTRSRTRREMNTWRDDINHEIGVFKILDADSNFAKIFVMSRWVEQIGRYRALQQYSVERHDHAHKTTLMDGWNDCNHNLNYLPQVITFQHHILYFQNREVILTARAERRENSAAASKVFPSGAGLAAPLGSQSYAKHKVVRPQNRRDGKHHDTMIKDFSALLNNMQGAMHRMAI